MSKEKLFIASNYIVFLQTITSSINIYSAKYSVKCQNQS